MLVAVVPHSHKNTHEQTPLLLLFRFAPQPLDHLTEEKEKDQFLELHSHSPFEVKASRVESLAEK